MKGVASVSPLAGRNTQLPILQSTLLDVRDGVLYLTCTDLEVGARVVVTGKAEQEGSCTVVARQLLEYIQQLPTAHPVIIKKEKKRLSVSTKGFNAQFPITKADDFPLLPEPPQGNVVALEGKLFCQALSSTIFAAARDEARPEIRSLFVRGEGSEVRVAATDSFRLAEQVISLKEEVKAFSFLLPVTTAQEVIRLFSGVEQLQLLIQENYVVFQADGIYLSSRLVEGAYPDYQQIIPSSFTTQGMIQRAELVRALKVVGVFLSRDSRRVVLSVKPSKELVELRAEGGDSGQGEVVIGFEGEGEDVEVILNIGYLLDGVQQGASEKCELGLGGESDPVVLRPEKKSERHIYVVMPIQT